MRPIKDRTFAMLLIVPAAILVFGIVLFPLLQTFWYTFQNMDITSSSYGEMVGIDNYKQLLGDQGFWETVGRTAYFTGFSLFLQLSLGILIALLLNEDLRGKTFLRSIFIIPWAVPTIVNGAMWKWIYHPEYGALNAFLSQIGLIDEYKSWLGDPWVAIHMVMFADSWKMTPLVAIFMLASLQMANKSVYEAAMMDGAGLLKRFYHLTLPYLKPTILVVLVMRTMDLFKVFDIIYATTRGGPANGTLTLTYEAYLTSFVEVNYSKGATISYLIAIMVAILTFVYVKTLKKGEE
jgi:multiple sugar transport system permease protein